jgi:hypothetical protein
MSWQHDIDRVARMYNRFLALDPTIYPELEIEVRDTAILRFYRARQDFYSVPTGSVDLISLHEMNDEWPLVTCGGVNEDNIAQWTATLCVAEQMLDEFLSAEVLDDVAPVEEWDILDWFPEDLYKWGYLVFEGERPLMDTFAMEDYFKSRGIINH